MDGLMVDSEPLWWRVEHTLAAEHGVSWTDELALGCVGGGLANVIRTMQTLGLSLDVDEGVEALVRGFLARLPELAMKPGCLELVQAARRAGVGTAVASSSTARLIGAVLARFDLGSLFDEVVSGEDVLRPKPAPDIFLLAANRLRVAPPDALVLEDSLAGVRAAVAATIPVIAVPEHAREDFRTLTPFVLADLHEARRLLGL